MKSRKAFSLALSCPFFFAQKGALFSGTLRTLLLLGLFALLRQCACSFALSMVIVLLLNALNLGSQNSILFEVVMQVFQTWSGVLADAIGEEVDEDAKQTDVLLSEKSDCLELTGGRLSATKAYLTATIDMFSVLLHSKYLGCCCDGEHLEESHVGGCHLEILCAVCCKAANIVEKHDDTFLFDALGERERAVLDFRRLGRGRKEEGPRDIDRR